MNGYFWSPILFSAKTAPSIMTVFRSTKNQLRAEKKLGILFVLAMATLYPFAVTSGVSAVYFIQNPGYRLRIAVALLYNIVFNLLLICCIYSLPFARLRSSLNTILWTYLAIFTLFSVAHLNIYKQLFGIPSLIAVGDTNFQESYEFIISLNKSTVIISTIATIPILCCLFISLKKTHSLSITLKFWPVASCWTFLFAISALGLEQPFVFQHNPFLYASWMVHEAVLSKAAFQSSVAHQTNNPVSLSISRPPPLLMYSYWVSRRPAAECLCMDTEDEPTHCSRVYEPTF